MTKKLVKHGNSYAFVIDKPIMNLLRIEPDTPLELTTDGRSLLITPAAPEAVERKKGFRKSLGRVMKRYGPAFKRLAE